MASHISLVISGLLLVLLTIVVQSVPIKKIEDIVQTPPSINDKQVVKQQLLKSVVSVESSSSSSSSSTTSTTSPTTSISESSSSLATQQEKNDNKKKRNINDDDQDQLDGLLDSDSESDENDDTSIYQLSDVKLNNNNNNQIKHILHTKIQETSATIHDNADKPVDTDDSNIFSDVKMTPSELTEIVRRRRDIKLNTESNRRHKRALSPYDFYDTDPLYNPYDDLLEGQQYIRPARSFAPLYWYPNVYERNIRSALASSFYEPSEWPRLYSSNIINDENDEDSGLLYNNDDDDDDENENINDYELNRYPILLQSSNNPFDNLELQQRYNTDDLPIDEDIEESVNDDDVDDNSDDDNEEQYRLFYQKQRPYYIPYGSIDTRYD
ncbi:unnamed protein product [Adineta steineri]|uniref:Uncharacterized protein n=1 Tax=Adineta steineri TaxID=433720 RepID=A0A813ULR0_9BILA|nr:unnamed protein product [Adineta steineri]CAF3676401.1 unnamed protein product [Adineta steineri]